MDEPITPSKPLTVLALLVLLTLPLLGLAAPPNDPGDGPVPPGLIDKAAEQGHVPVIVELSTGDTTSVAQLLRAQGGRGNARQALGSTPIRNRLAAIRTLQDRIAAAVADRQPSIRRFQYVPAVALDADSLTLERLQSLPQVLHVTEDRLHPVDATAINTVPVIRAPTAWAAGYTGAGEAVVIADTGVQTHEMFTGRITDEACFSTQYYSSDVSLCPSGPPKCRDASGNVISYSACGTGAADPANCIGITGCDHGTHVSGIAAGNGSLIGVAPDALIVPIKVFMKYQSSGSWHLAAYTSDLIRALEHVLQLSASASYQIAAVNMSLGGVAYTSTVTCDTDQAAFKLAVDNLRAVGIATVVAAGNDGKSGAIDEPGCVSTVVSVGATNSDDSIAYYSNYAPALSVFAPGTNVLSAIFNNQTGYKSGTSMATPHVTGSFALLGQKAQELSLDAGVGNLLAALQETGKPIPYGVSGDAIPRIQVDTALDLVAAPLPLETIVDSDLDLTTNPQQTPPRVTVVSGTFSQVSDGTAYGGDARIGTGTTTENRIRFEPGLAPGYYAVSLWWPTISSNTAAAQVSVKHSGGTDTLSPISQTANGGHWNPIGDYVLDANSNVELADGGVAGLAADAVDFQFLSTSPPPFSIQTQSLPDGTVGTQYQAQILTSGGASPVTLQATNGLPPGLSLASGSGILSGVPSTAGTYSLNVQATDGIGRAASATLGLQILPAGSSVDTLWVEDATPAGATVVADSGWSWRSSSPTTPYSGSLALQSGIGSGQYRYAFVNVPTGWPVATGDTLFAYVWIDPANPPRELLLVWQGTGTNQYEHRAYWGENLLNYGVDGTASRLPMGALPATGQWVRLAVPAASLGLEGQTVYGMGLYLYNGRAAFDHLGKTAP